jgi:thiamine-phosphate pyrophosphorylase
MNVAEHLRLMLILDIPLLGDRDPVATAAAAVRGGATSVQLRWKGGADNEVAALARELRHALTVPLLVNDRLDIALATGCAGVHLGADDLPLALARKIVPAGFHIGASVGDEQEARSSKGADYVGIGPWRTTTTKRDAGHALGAEGVRHLLSLVTAPAVVIGGVRPVDVAEIAVLGAAGVAVAGGILGETEVESAARNYIR